MGTLLQVKPLLSFSKGYIEPIQQVRTTRRADERLIELTAAHLGDDPRPWISVMHSRSSERALLLLHALRSRFPGARFFYSEIGPIIGAHIGPGGVGVIACPSRVL